jgi:hypothetical protein
MAKIHCKIRICFHSSELFESAGFSTTLKKDTCKEKTLLPQIDTDSGTKTMVKVFAGLKKVLEIAIGAGFILNYLIKFGMGNIWEILTGLQLIVHYPMLKVNAPGNINMLQAALILIASFEPIDTDILKEHLWKYDLEEIVNYFL